MIYMADYVFMQGKILSGKTIYTNQDGRILGIEDQVQHDEIPKLNGIILPGIFNCHAHIELAGCTFDKSEGLTDFIDQIKNYYMKKEVKNNFSEIQNLDSSLYRQGIEFCADIVNTEKTIEVKKKSKLSYYNFIEYFETSTDDSQNKQHSIISLLEKFKTLSSQTFLCPHSLYSISNSFVDLYKSYSFENKHLASIHFKETFKENFLKEFQREIYNSHTYRKLADMLQKFKKDLILQLLTELFDTKQKILFVHNIYMNEKESSFIYETFKDSALCVCPTSNFFIEKKLTEKSNIERFQKKVFLGTDSPASNEKMCFASEMFLFQKHYDVKIEELIKICTEYPSIFFQQRDKGKIELGKMPGLVLLTSVDYNEMKLTEKSRTIRLI